MKKKKIKNKEGDVFAVPLVNGKYAVGLMARKSGKIALGYFFNKVYDSAPSQVESSGLSREKIVLIGQFSSIGIDDGEWPLIMTDFVFTREDWPIPLFKTKEPITGKYFAVAYKDDLLYGTRHPISEFEAALYFEDGLYGYLALSDQLSKILKVDA